jgi:hypothetical protein
MPPAPQSKNTPLTQRGFRRMIEDPTIGTAATTPVTTAMTSASGRSTH